MISNNKISNLVASQVPFFVRNDHDNFVAFVEAYYEFLEQQTGVVNVSRNLLDQSDVDLTDIFVEKFYDNFLPLIPKDTAVDKTLILKHIKDFYRARGTEKSIRFLMRILFDEEVEFYYPQRDILRVSDGKWYQEKSVKITNLKVNGVANSSLGIETKFINRRIDGDSSNAYALVERTSAYYEGSSLVLELRLSNQYKTFDTGEGITSTFFENGVEKTITANLFSGGINTVEIIRGGTRYKIGDQVSIEGGGGTGGTIIVTSVSSGNLTSVAALNGGAGFQSGNQILISGGGGTGANANVLTVSADGFYHPNTYNIVSSIISLEANTALNNTWYANLNSSTVVNANSTIANSVSFFVYANTGPITGVLLYDLGSGYTTAPTITAQANTRVRNLGILGKMKIVSGGTGYYIGDTITFENVLGGYGTGAAARVKNVDMSQANTISAVEFVNVPGHITGGTGYDQLLLPRANVVSVNAQAYGANIEVTAVLGSGETLVSANTSEGQILSLEILARGSGYTTVPTLNLSQFGDGTAQAVATIITGTFTYPGRYLNDDGHISSYNFIQDRDYYQKFSYVVKVKESIERYRAVLKDLIHPAGMKLFGEYSTVDENANANVTVTGLSEFNTTISLRNYTLSNGNLIINYTNHGLSVGNTIYLDWYTGNVANRGIEKGPYEVKTVLDSSNVAVYTTPYIETQSNLTALAGSTASTRDLFIKPDGTTLYASSATRIRIFNFDRPYDVSTLDYVDEKSYSSVYALETTVYGLTFSPDGDYYYTVGQDVRNVEQFRMTEKWNILTANIEARLNLQTIAATQYELFPQAIAFSNNGTKMYVVGTSNDVIFQFNVSTPWQVNTANYETKSIDVGDSNPTGMKFSANGKYVYIVGSGTDTIRMFTLGTNWNVNTAVYTTNSIPTSTMGSQFTSLSGIDLKSDANVFYVLDNATTSIIQLPTSVTGNPSNVYYEASATGTANVSKIIV